MTCNKTLDVVLLIDGSGSLGQTGWDAEKKAAALFVDSFINGGADTQMALILFSGPSTWGGVFQCIGASSTTVSLPTVCKVTTETHFTKDLATVKTDIQNLNWPQGSTLTSVALMAAKAELSLGRSDAHSIIIVFTDGRPLSRRKTFQAAREVREAARLVWVPVTQFAPLSDIKKWATRRWQENVVVVKTFEDLEKPWVVTQIIANICPSVEPELTFG
jgi:Mg-chelatase subunit ChlD